MEPDFLSTGLQSLKALPHTLTAKHYSCSACVKSELMMSAILYVFADLCVQALVSSMQAGSKAIFHLEAFVAKFMSEYKQWTIMSFG